MEWRTLIALAPVVVLPLAALAKDTSNSPSPVADAVIAQQRAALAANTAGKGFGPQSPRDIDALDGRNSVAFGEAPAHTDMNLCNIHFHKNAEHRGGEFTTYAGNGDGKGRDSGFRYSGTLPASVLAGGGDGVCPGQYGALMPGDTIEVHYVHSTAQVSPGPTLGACLNESIKNPQLRVEAQVLVLANDAAAADFRELVTLSEANGRHQAPNIPGDTGTPVQYAGSTTGPGYNEAGSPFQVTWSVRPAVMTVDMASVGAWCESNVFDEDHAHGVRNLVTNPDLLSEIRR